MSENTDETVPKMEPVVGESKPEPAKTDLLAIPNQDGNAHSGFETDESVEDDQQEEEGDVEIVTLDPEDTNVDLTHMRIKQIEGMEILTSVEFLGFRNNLIKRIENLNMLGATLRELELYDNQIEKIENLDELVNLEVLDLSFNRIRKIEGLDRLTKLKKLYFVHNKITKIENISHLVALEMLELGANRVRKIENLDGLVSLKELFLGKNKISRLENMESLANLTLLSIQSNRIVKIENLTANRKLDSLYLSHNGIQVMEGLEENERLETLDLAGNRITKLENLSHLATSLAELWLNDNFIADWTSIDATLRSDQLPRLRTVYLERNPIATGDPMYRKKLMMIAPQLSQIDSTIVRLQ